MSKEIDDRAISKFLLAQAAKDVTDFGYLLIPSDERLNDEALSHIKDKFKAYLVENGYEELN